MKSIRSSFVCRASFPLATMAFLLLSASCGKKPKNPPVPEGISALRISGPAKQRVFFEVSQEKVDGMKFSNDRLSGDQRLPAGDVAYELPISYQPNKYTGLRIQVAAPLAGKVKVELVAGGKVVESRESSGAGEVVEFVYGKVRQQGEDAFAKYRPGATHRYVIAGVLAILQGERSDLPEDQSDAVFRHHGELGVRALASGLKTIYGEVTPSTADWVVIPRDNQQVLIEGAVLAGGHEVPINLWLKDGRVQTLYFQAPSEDFNLAAHAGDILEENSRQFLTHFFEGRMAEVEAMVGYKKQVTPEYLDVLRKGTPDYWKQGEALESKGLHLVQSLEKEVRYASAFAVSSDKSDYPHPQVWYAHAKGGGSSDSEWERAEFFLINFVFTKTLADLKGVVAP